MARGCSGMMGEMRGNCGMPRRRREFRHESRKMTKQWIALI